MSIIHVRDLADRPLSGINIRLSIGSLPSEQAYDDRFTDKAGNTAWPNPLPSKGYTLHVNQANVDPRFIGLSIPVKSLDEDISIRLSREALRRLVSIDTARHRLVDDRGHAFYGRGSSFFLGYKRFLDGHDLHDQLAQLEGSGCNLIRVMGMFESLGGFDPKGYPNYYDRIPEFCGLVESYGLYVLWTACAATGSVFTLDGAARHIEKTVDRLVTTNNALFSPVNEQGQHNNSIDRARFQREVVESGRIGWLVYDTGSFGGDLAVEPPFGMYAPFHVRRDYPSSVKDCGTIDHTNRVQHGLEIGVDEPYRMGDEGSGGRHDDPIVAREAAGIAYNALYFVAHSMQGERADLLTGNTLDCVSAAMDAMKGH